MPAQWEELQTDQEWDPWVLKQLFSTLAGWSNDEAVAINATTINDPNTVASTWKNGGGGGASRWISSDGSLIGEAMDDSFTVGKQFAAPTGSFSGEVHAGSIDASGPISGESLAIDTDAVINGQVAASHVEAGTGTFSGLVGVGELVSDGDVSGVNGTFTGDVSGVGGTFTGAVSAGDANSDAHTIIGVTTFRASSGLTQATIDAGNNRSVFGASSGTPMSNDLTPSVQVKGRLYVAPETDNDLAQEWRRSAAATSGWKVGVTSTNEWALKDLTDVERLRVGGTGADSYAAIGTSTVLTGAVRLPNNQFIYSEETGLTDRRLIGLDSGNVLRVGDSLATGPGTASMGATSAIYMSVGGAVLAQFVPTGISFFGVAAVVRQTGGAATAGATYTATEQQMLNRAYQAMRQYGLLT